MSPLKAIRLQLLLRRRVSPTCHSLRALPLRALPLRALPLRALPLRALLRRALPLRALLLHSQLLRSRLLGAFFFVPCILACSSPSAQSTSPPASERPRSLGEESTPEPSPAPSSQPMTPPTGTQEYQLRGRGEAIFAGGCFWCMEGPFERLPGVREVYAGYSGGTQLAPTYEQVSHGESDHREAVIVLYDPEQTSYEELLHVFWRSINPTQANGQFADIGPHYQTAIYFLSEAQRRAALSSRAALSASAHFSQPIVTEILPGARFWLAEERHQDYYKKHPRAYARYRWGSGRQPFLERHWVREAH